MPDVFKNFTAFLASRLALSSWDQALLTMADIAVPDIAGTIINFWPGLWGFAKMEVDPNGDEVLMVGTGGAVGAASYDSRVYLCSPFVGSQIDFILLRPPQRGQPQQVGMCGRPCGRPWPAVTGLLA